jgi:NADH:ubiquinone oxidoreductase subunit 5 (subunit L)/multisubunit Na+/H+ antiporter MnhA subunit
MTALLVTALGGLAMMAGFVLVGLAAGTFTISELVNDAALRRTLAESPVFVPALIFILIGAFTKSAQAPFHFWLPGAMVAPTPVSTYLHAATMVKAGIFLLGRLAPMFADSGIWAPALVAFGLTTFFLGAWQAFRETDLKLMLARTTVSTLGLVTMLYGLGAADQDTLQVLSHAAYKGALFLVVGIVEHVAHTRDLRQLGGLRIELPLTFLACAGAALSMAGLPPFLGFLAKEAVYGALLESPVLQSAMLVRELVVVATVVANAFLFAVGFRILSGVFLGARAKMPAGPDDHRAVSRTPRLVPGHAPEEAHGESLLLWLPPLFLTALALGMGLLGATPLTGNFVNRFSSDPSAQLRVSLVPAHAGPFLLSLVTIALGVLLYKQRETVERLQRRLAAPTSMQSLWDSVLERVTDFAVAFSSFWQSGSLRWYFSGILGFFVLIALVALGRGGLSIGEASAGFGNLTWYEPLLCALMAASAVAVVRAQTRLAATIALTSNGFLVALMYVVYRSPDILLTQILIETVSTIFVLLVLFFMPVFRKDGPSPARTAQNGGIAAAVGVVMFLFVVLCTSPGFKETNTIAADYLSRSLTAGGQNAVNVIIVDFRAMDTQGEITVLVMVGLCVYGVLRSRRRTA